jgi:integration host factor subunit beta
MTKTELIEEVARRSRIAQTSAEAAVGVFFDTITDGLGEGKRVEIRGFGSFKVKDYDGYMGRNPRSGEPVNVPPKRLPVFRVGKELKRSVDNGGIEARIEPGAAERKAQ